MGSNGASDGNPWARPATDAGGEQLTDHDLDVIRRRIVELDDLQRALPPDDLAGRHALLEATDDLRAVLRAGHADEMDRVRKRWEMRAGRKGDHDVDPLVVEAIVKSMISSAGSAGT